ncbi:MAG: PBSX family phage terminase large subunit [Alphaproteobacteria bacterium]|nr:PBSX family phage terminase large subunit [Alphaproteobacteria bacterium]
MATEIFPIFQDYLQPARFKVAYGGRGSAKTRTLVSIATNNVMCYGWRVVAFREVMKSIDDSIYQEFVDEIERRDLYKYFTIYKSYIQSNSGGIIKFDGLLRNTQKIKGYSGFDLAFLEEAEKISSESWKYLVPTMRKESSEIWVIFNPDTREDETYKKFVTNCQYPAEKDGKPYCIVKKINYTDNPRFPDNLRIDMEIMKEHDYDMYRHVYLGEPVSAGDFVVIKPKWIDAAIDAHIKLGFEPRGMKIAGFDPFDGGQDSHAYVARQGPVISNIKNWNTGDTGEGTRTVISLCKSDKVYDLQFDSIGIGAGVKTEINRMITEDEETVEHSLARPLMLPANLSVQKWVASAKVLNPSQHIIQDDPESPKNKDFYKNLKSQGWWSLRNRFEKTYKALTQGEKYDTDELISIPSSLKYRDELVSELSQPTYSHPNGLILIDKKPTGTKSPNLADATVMAFWPVPKLDFNFGMISGGPAGSKEKMIS